MKQRLLRAAGIVVAVTLLLGTVAAADPFYSPPEPVQPDPGDAPKQLARDALNTTATGDYRMDWVVPCNDERDDAETLRRAGGCVFQRFHVEHSERNLLVEAGEPYVGSGPDMYADEASFSAYAYPGRSNWSESRAELVWDGFGGKLDRRSLAVAMARPGLTPTATTENGTRDITFENDSLVYWLLSGQPEPYPAAPSGFTGNLTVAVDAETGHLGSITVQSSRPSSNETGRSQYVYDQWGETDVRRPVGTSRPLLGWLRDVVNWEYRP